MSTARAQNFAMTAGLREVFHHFSYILLAAAVAIGFFVFAVWLPNLNLIAHVVARGDVALGAKLTLLINLLGSIGTNFTLFSAISTIIIAILFGVNVAMIIYFVKKGRAALGGGGFFASAGGIGSGIVGIGCVACGSLVLSAILPVVGAAGIIALLPLKGREFGIASIGLLLTSIFLISRKIIQPVVCKPQFSKP